MFFIKGLPELDKQFSVIDIGQHIRSHLSKIELDRYKRHDLTIIKSEIENAMDYYLMPPLLY